MRVVTAIVKPYKLDDVREVLSDYNDDWSAGIRRMTVTEVTGWTRDQSTTATASGIVSWNKNPYFKIEVAVESSLVALIVNLICEAGSTRKVGDGIVWVSRLDKVVRISTGEIGQDAL